MRNRKLERALYGPTVWEITFGLVLSVALGAVLAVVFLILKPVQVVQEEPKEDERKAGAVYYIAGSSDYAKAKQWTRKRQLLVEGRPGEVTLTEDDLNVWSASSSGTPPDKAPAPAKPAGAQEEAPPAEMFVPSVLNFRIQDNAMQVALPTQFNVLGFSFQVIAQSRGTFQKEGDMFMYNPDTMMIGSLPLHNFPGAVDYVKGRVLSNSALPEELMAAWRRVNKVSLEARSLRLTIQ